MDTETKKYGCFFLIEYVKMIQRTANGRRLVISDAEAGVFSMKLHTKKMIAPIVVTIITAGYLLFYLAVILFGPMPCIGKVLLGAAALALLGVSVGMLVQRIREIRSGEEDDLSQY